MKKGVESIWATLACESHLTRRLFLNAELPVKISLEVRKSSDDLEFESVPVIYILIPRVFFACQVIQVCLPFWNRWLSAAQKVPSFKTTDSQIASNEEHTSSLRQQDDSNIIQDVKNEQGEILRDGCDCRKGVLTTMSSSSSIVCPASRLGLVFTPLSFSHLESMTAVCGSSTLEIDKIQSRPHFRTDDSMSTTAKAVLHAQKLSVSNWYPNALLDYQSISSYQMLQFMELFKSPRVDGPDISLFSEDEKRNPFLESPNSLLTNIKAQLSEDSNNQNRSCISASRHTSSMDLSSVSACDSILGKRDCSELSFCLSQVLSTWILAPLIVRLQHLLATHTGLPISSFPRSIAKERRNISAGSSSHKLHKNMREYNCRKSVESSAVDSTMQPWTFAGHGWNQTGTWSQSAIQLTNKALSIFQRSTSFDPLLVSRQLSIPARYLSGQSFGFLSQQNCQTLNSENLTQQSVRTDDQTGNIPCQFFSINNVSASLTSPTYRGLPLLVNMIIMSKEMKILSRKMVMPAIQITSSCDEAPGTCQFSTIEDLLQAALPKNVFQKVVVSSSSLKLVTIQGVHPTACSPLIWWFVVTVSWKCSLDVVIQLH